MTGSQSFFEDLLNKANFTVSELICIYANLDVLLENVTPSYAEELERSHFYTLVKNFEVFVLDKM